MAIGYLRITVGSRSGGKSAVAAASYRSGSKMRDLEQNREFDFTRKNGVAHSEVTLPDYAPAEFANREKLWNSVQCAERKKGARLFREIMAAVPRELSRDQQIRLGRDFAKSLAAQGLCADWSFPDKGDGNPHIHFLCTTRPLNSDGSWAEAKERKAYALDTAGNRIPIIDPKTGKQKIGARGRKLWKRVSTKANVWDEAETAKKWKLNWERCANAALREAGQDAHIDMRSYRDREGLEACRIPQQHLSRSEFLRCKALGIPPQDLDAVEHNRRVDRALQQMAALEAVEQRLTVPAIRDDLHRLEKQAQIEQDLEMKRDKRARHDAVFRRRAREGLRQRKAEENLEKRYGVAGRPALSLRRRALAHGEESVTLYSTYAEAVTAHPELAHHKSEGYAYSRGERQLRKQLKRDKFQDAGKVAKNLVKGRGGCVFAVSCKAGRATIAAVKVTANVLDCVGKVAGKVPIAGAPVKLICGLPKAGMTAAERAAGSLNRLAAGRQSIDKTLQELGRTAKDVAKKPVQAAKMAKSKMASAGKLLDKFAGHDASGAAGRGGVNNLVSEGRQDAALADMRGNGLVAQQQREEAARRELFSEEEIGDKSWIRFTPNVQQQQVQQPQRVRTRTPRVDGDE